MKPNFKALAEGYRQKWRDAENNVRSLLFVIRKKKEAIADQEREIDSLKAKYREALECIVELQEAILMKETNEKKDCSNCKNKHSDRCKGCTTTYDVSSGKYSTPLYWQAKESEDTNG